MSFSRSEIEPFRCEVEPQRAVVRLRPVGELDIATVPIVEEQLAELWSVGFAHLVVDLREVSFLDSTGLRMLLTWDAISRADAMKFGVIRGPEVVQRVLEIAGVAVRLTYWSSNGSGPRIGE
jgi:anti-sigma B factor antagonist